MVKRQQVAPIRIWTPDLKIPPRLFKHADQIEVCDGCGDGGIAPQIRKKVNFSVFMLYYGMRKRHKHKKDKYKEGSCHPAPQYGRMGEWVFYNQDKSVLPKSSPAGYAKDDWEDAIVESLLTCSREIELLDRAYRSKFFKMEAEYAHNLEEGYEQAYKLVCDLHQQAVSEKDKYIKQLEGIINECCPNHAPMKACELPKKQTHDCCHQDG